MCVRLFVCTFTWLLLFTGQEFPNQAIGVDWEASEVCGAPLPQGREPEFYESEDKHFIG